MYDSVRQKQPFQLLSHNDRRGTTASEAAFAVPIMLGQLPAVREWQGLQGAFVDRRIINYCSVQPVLFWELVINQGVQCSRLS